MRRNGYVFFLRSWLSNWTRSPFTIDGVTYSCVEQYMMAEKARLFGDSTTEAAILATDSPREQKDLGRRVRGYDEPRWAAVRRAVVLRATLEKYRQNPELKAKLLAEEGTFVETNPADPIWGIGMSMDEAGVEDPTNWRGQNLLGQVITEARDILRKEQ